MRRLLVAIAALCALLVACDQPYVQAPPERFRDDGQMVVVFSSDPDAACRRIGAQAERGKTIVGCHHGQVAVLPNPCHWPQASDYRDVACHELAHHLGWPSDHPR